MRLIMSCAAIAAALALGTCNPACADELNVSTRDGMRSAVLLPAKRSHAPTVVVLHGALDSADHVARWYGFTEAARRRGFAAVFPRGANLLWNDGRDAAVASDADDVDFLRHLARDVVALGVADAARIYLVGISNGGMMTLRMLCEAPELFAGAGVIVASMPSTVGTTCRLRRPMPVVMFAGTADPLIPYRGGEVGFTGLEGSVWPVERTAAFLARGNGCGSPWKSVVAGSAAPDAIRVVRLVWRGCASGRGVVLYRVEGGGHQVYGHTNFLPVYAGIGTNLTSAPDVIIAAFARH
jgi:polyhydroxybutyrate depolymerase